jgi:hypothetical protein
MLELAPATYLASDSCPFFLSTPLSTKFCLKWPFFRVFIPKYAVCINSTLLAQRCWLTPVILATQEAKIRRIAVRSQPRVNSSKDPISAIIFITKRSIGVAQGVSLAFKPQYQSINK